MQWITARHGHCVKCGANMRGRPGLYDKRAKLILCAECEKNKATKTERERR